MHSQRRPSSGRPSESLEARLRALPAPPVPRHLEARLVAARPAGASNEIVRRAHSFRVRRLAIRAGAAVAAAAACSLAVLTWPRPHRTVTAPSLVPGPEKQRSAYQVSAQQPYDFLGIKSWMNDRADLYEAARPLFTWPVQEESPLTVSTSTRPDRID
jgi:hypothetical protein